jgi:hypothetical protein
LIAHKFRDYSVLNVIFEVLIGNPVTEIGMVPLLDELDTRLPAGRQVFTGMTTGSEI